jgi:DNA/RNA-binding domain of Phe-tRNA-synthetase-like protein
MTVSKVGETVNALAVLLIRPASCHLKRRSRESENYRYRITRTVAHQVSPKTAASRTRGNRIPLSKGQFATRSAEEFPDIATVKAWQRL